MGFIVWEKIEYPKICMINTDKKQKGVADIIEARNKYRMLRTRKQQIAACLEVCKEN